MPDGHPVKGIGSRAGHDVFTFVTVREIEVQWAQIERYLGKSRELGEGCSIDGPRCATPVGQRAPREAARSVDAPSASRSTG